MDTAAYVELARHPPAAAYFVSPLYVYFLRLAGVSLLAARLGQILLGSIAVVLIFDTARRWSVRLSPAASAHPARRPDKSSEATQEETRAPDIAASLAILCGAFTFYEVTILQAALDPFLVSLTLWTLTIALQGSSDDGPDPERNARTAVHELRFATAGIALGLFVLNRPNALLWLPLLAIAIALSPAAADRTSRPRLLPSWRAAVALLAGFALPIAPVTIRNYAVSHELVLIASHGGLNFFIGNNAEADGTYHHVDGIRPTIAGQEEDAPRVAAARMHQPSAGAAEASDFFYRQAWEWIRSQPAAALALFLRKVAYTFNQTDLALNYSLSYFTRDVRSPLTLLLAGPWLLFPLGLAGALRLGLERRAGGGRRLAARTSLSAQPARRYGLDPFVIWATFIPLYALSVAIFFVSSRYRLPLLVPMCVTAPVMFMRPLRVGYWVAAVAVAIAVCWNFGLDDGRAHERTNMIVYLVEQHRFDEAGRLVDSTAAMTRDAGTLYLRSIEAFEHAGQFDRALQLATTADPARMTPEQRNRIAVMARRFGVACVQANESEKALAAFTAANRLDPTEPADLVNMAVLEAERGDFRAAREHAKAALRLRPGYGQAEGLLQAIAGR